MATRLKVNPEGGHLHEFLTRKKDEKGFLKTSDLVVLKPGTIFLHPDDARASVLLALRPAVVIPTSEETTEEKAKKATVTAEGLRIAGEKVRKDATETVRKREETLAKLELDLKKKSPADLEADCKKRGLTLETNAPDTMLQAIIADERIKMENAPAA